MAYRTVQELTQHDFETLTTKEQLRLMVACMRAMVPFPHVLRKYELPACGARCRDGHRCRARAVRNYDGDWQNTEVRNGRCRMHGGWSTGPRTEEGCERMREAVRQRWVTWREAHPEPRTRTPRPKTDRSPRRMYTWWREADHG